MDTSILQASQLHVPENPSDWISQAHPDWISAIPYQYAKRHGVLAVNKDKERVHVLCPGTPAMPVISELRRKLGGRVAFHELNKSDFDRLLRQAYDKGQSEATQMMDDLGDEIDLDLLTQELPEITDLLEASDDAPVVRLINALLTQAIREDASDIHIEAFEQRSIVRFRVDGVLKDVVEPQRALHAALVSRVKVMAKLDIAEKRLPQDGRMSLRVGDKPIDVRISTLPTQHGERVVMRLLDKQGARLNLADLGMHKQIRENFDRLIHTPHGILLVTGPTGSGKTTTLYAGLTRLDRDRMNILTVEDPIEYDLDGVGQTQVQPKIDLTFASGLRSILRQDPDVVLVGEIRDLETAEIAIQASLTGHLVLSTLHTNSAVGAITRLVDMGVEHFLISSSLLAVLAQRLVRLLCKNCKEQYEPDEAERDLLRLKPGAQTNIYRAKGCNQCDYTGYRGRTGIHEMIVIDDQLRRMIHDQKSEGELIQYARTKSHSIGQDGFSKVLHGVTSLDEVVRVTHDN